MKVQQLKELYQKTVDEWLEQKKTTIEKETIEFLNKGKTDILYKLVGFDSRWGKGYEIDHCNGRSGNSIVGDILRDKQKEAIEKWISESLTLPELSPQLIKEMNSYYLREYKRTLKEAVQALAQERAREALKIIDL